MFDVVITNPPYQRPDGGFCRSSVLIFPDFYEQAKSVSGRYIVFVVPGRWQTDGRGLRNFRNSMLRDRNIRELHDFPFGKHLFQGAEISGGVCYFLRDSLYFGPCRFFSHQNQSVSMSVRYLDYPYGDICVRFNEAVPIVEKVISRGEQSFSELVSKRAPFGIRTFVLGRANPNPGDVLLYRKKGVGYVSRAEIRKNQDWVDKYKLLIPRAYGGQGGPPRRVFNNLIIAAPRSACSETYNVVGPFDTEGEAANAMSYAKTRFFRFLVYIASSTQQLPRSAYRLVPIQTFAKPWTDDELYEKYGLDDSEIAYIERMIRPI